MITEKIFVSYARADGADAASRLSLDLKRRGFDVWIDQEDIRAGAEWDLEIEKALKTSDCVLFIETEKSVSSNNVLDEVYYALEQKKKVIPLIFVDGKTPFRLQRLQHIDFSKDYESGLALLINELNRTHAAEPFAPDAAKSITKIDEPFYKKYRKLIAVLGLLLVVVAATLFFTPGNKNKIATNVSATPAEKAVDVNEFVGDWALLDVDPRARQTRGYLKIEDVDGRRVTIKSHLQFYYVSSNDTLFLTVFNAFAGCSSCVLQNHTKLTVEDVAVSSRHIKTSKGNKANSNSSDTLMDAGSTKSIRASATLHMIDNQAVVIEVKHPVATMLANDLLLQPFVYSFKFRKRE